MNKLLLSLLLLFLCLHSSLANVNVANNLGQQQHAQETSLVQQNDINNGNVTYGDIGFPGSDKKQEESNHAKEFEHLFPFVFLLLVPISFFLFYHQILDSYVGDTRLRGRCQPNHVTRAGYHTLHIPIPVSENIPDIISFSQFVVMSPNKDLSAHHAKQGDKGVILIPFNLLEDSLLDGASAGFAVADSQGSDDIQNGDIIIGLDCREIEYHVTQDSPSSFLNHEMHKRGHYMGLRLPLYLTILRPEVGNELCPPFSYFSLNTDYCCDHVTEECEMKDRVDTVSRDAFVEATSSKVLRELLREKSFEKRGKSTDVEKSTQLPTESVHFQMKQKPGMRTTQIFSRIKHLIIVIIVAVLSFIVLYIPFHIEHSETLRFRYALAFLVLSIFAILLWMYGGYFSASLSAKNKKKTSFYATVVCVWLISVMLPGATFIMNRALATNYDQRVTMQFNFLTNFFGLMLSTLYFIHTFVSICKDRFSWDAPQILTDHLGELVLGTASFLDALAGFRDLSRTLYSNGGACNVANLAMRLKGISRNGKPVKWVCDTDQVDTVDLDIAQGKSCMVNCGNDVIKPVICHDYGLTGGDWSIIEQNVTKFCCHPFACDAQTETYCPDLCDAENTGCRLKTQGCS